MLTLQNLGKATLGLGVAAALAFGASEATAKSAKANCEGSSGLFGYCSTHAECDATCASMNLPPGGCFFLVSEGAKCCNCAV